MNDNEVIEINSDQIFLLEIYITPKQSAVDKINDIVYYLVKYN